MKIFIATPFKDNKKLGNYEISHIDYSSFLKEDKNFIEIIKHGYFGSSLFGRLRNPEFINRLYLSKDSNYLNYLAAFKERYEKYDVIVMNPGLDLVHPEYLHKNFPNTLKCLHFIDDPHATYSYGFPFSWAFDCATYISPSYNENFSMKEILNLAGFKNTKWVPHNSSNVDPIYKNTSELIRKNQSRKNKIIYVGGYYSGKIDRLLSIKKYFKNDFDIFGSFPFKGWALFAKALKKGFFVPYKVNKISELEKESLYSKYSIGLNMHLSYPSKETGNARLYELAYRGLAQVVDSSNISEISKIFEPNEEILTYESKEECIHQLERLIKDNNLRNKLSINSYERAMRDYKYENTLLDLFNWFKEIKKQDET
tara:strand:+ start:1003 stop:2109 length:1107 start_codon:yes stop_codon:yes gene_type:complete